MFGDYVEVGELVGKTFKAVTQVDDSIRFGAEYILKHEQDCCESVYLEDVCGDLSDLAGTPIVVAEERTNLPDPGKKEEYDDSYTWKFYRFSTIKGTVTLRFYGTSNGYYSESVQLTKNN